MQTNSVQVDLEKLRHVCESIPDWWGISLPDLERLASALLGRRREGNWVRQGKDRAIIASKKFGAVAKTLPAEFAALARDSRRIFADGRPDSVLRAAAFYHLRFENIHPLHDGNGRTGRTIMTGQFYQSFGYSPALFEQQLIARFAEYKQVFKAEDFHSSYRLLLLLLSQILRVPVFDANLAPGYSFEPLFRSKGTPEVAHAIKPAPEVSFGKTVL